MQSIVLQTSHVRGSHTAVNLVDSARAVGRKFGPERAKVRVLVHEKGVNMMVAGCTLEEEDSQDIFKWTNFFDYDSFEHHVVLFF